MAESIKGVYRPKNPTTKDFYKLVEDHAEHLELLYPEKYEKLFGFYPRRKWRIISANQKTSRAVFGA